jgi:hypothetical protein
MYAKDAKIINFTTRETFWTLADHTKTIEKYKIDENLQYLSYAPIDILKKIFLQYRFFTHYYITDLAILISKLPFGDLRSILAEILFEELGNGDANGAHPVLYDNFLLSIGIEAAELDAANADCLKNLENIQNSLREKSWGYGIGLRGMGGECLCQIYLATMHEYFSKNPAIQAIEAQIAWKFWEIHIGEVDLHHQRIVRDAIDAAMVAHPEIVNDLTQGYLESKTAWDNFWQQIFIAANNISYNGKLNHE